MRQSDPMCNQCRHGQSIHNHHRSIGRRKGAWTCVLEHCHCSYRGAFQERVEFVPLRAQEDTKR